MSSDDYSITTGPEHLLDPHFLDHVEGFRGVEDLSDDVNESPRENGDHDLESPERAMFQNLFTVVYIISSDIPHEQLHVVANIGKISNVVDVTGIPSLLRRREKRDVDVLQIDDVSRRGLENMGERLTSEQPRDNLHEIVHCVVRMIDPWGSRYEPIHDVVLV